MKEFLSLMRVLIVLGMISAWGSIFSWVNILFLFVFSLLALGRCTFLCGFPELTSEYNGYSTEEAALHDSCV